MSDKLWEMRLDVTDAAEAAVIARLLEGRKLAMQVPGRQAKQMVVYRDCKVVETAPEGKSVIVRMEVKE